MEGRNSDKNETINISYLLRASWNQCITNTFWKTTTITMYQTDRPATVQQPDAPVLKTLSLTQGTAMPMSARILTV